MTSSLFTTLQLKERGWTPAMIRDLLGAPDAERPNQRRPGRALQPLDRPIQLYWEARVLEAEAQEGFAEARVRGQLRVQAALKGKHFREQRQAAQLARYLALPVPDLIPPPGAATWTRARLWTYHLSDYYHWGSTHDHVLRSLPRPLKREAQRHTFERHRQTFEALYSDRDVQP